MDTCFRRYDRGDGLLMEIGSMNKRVLIFAPHPDDAELTMGGTIIKLIAEGWEVVVADLTNGEPTPAGTPEIRAVERRRATEILGIEKRVCLGMPNRYLEDNLEYRRIMAECIREFQPRWLFTTYRPDAHPDHIHGSSLTEDARFTAKLTKTDMAHEPWYPEKIFYSYASHLRVHPQPKLVLDVSDYWEQKLESVRAYQSQFWDNQVDESRKGWIIDLLNVIGRYFGLMIGVKYGEPFFCHELVGLKNLDSVL